MRDFNHIRLRYLAEVINTGAIRKAATKMGIAPSAVSRQITLLEEELGLGVIERHRRGVIPTEVGQLLMTYYRQYTAQRNSILAEIKSLQGLHSGTVHIATGEGLIQDLINGPLHTFKKNFPDIAISIQVMSAREILGIIREDEAEIGLLLNQNLKDPSVSIRGKQIQPLVAIIPRNHPLANKKKVNLEELSLWPIGLLDERFGIRQVIEHAAYVAKVQLVPSLSTNSINCLIEHTTTGKGITILPEFCVRKQLEHDDISAISISDEILKNSEIQIITRVGRYLSPAANRFLSYCLRDLPALKA